MLPFSAVCCYLLPVAFAKLGRKESSFLKLERFWSFQYGRNKPFQSGKKMLSSLEKLLVSSSRCQSSFCEARKERKLIFEGGVSSLEIKCLSSLEIQISQCTWSPPWNFTTIFAEPQAALLSPCSSVHTGPSLSALLQQSSFPLLIMVGYVFRHDTESWQTVL